jgi:hypothetical protein
VNLRYTPQDITTPVPGGYISWLWRILHKPTHQMRVRIAARIYNSSTQDSPVRSTSPSTSAPHAIASGYDTNIFDQPAFRENDASEDGWGAMNVDVPGGSGNEDVGASEQKVLDRVAEDLARLGRVKRVGLTVEDKIEFVKVWGSRKR